MKLIVDVDREAGTLSVTISDSTDYRPEVLRDWLARALEAVSAEYQLLDAFDSAPH